MMSCIATVGECGITTKPSVTNQQINSVICNDHADPQFIYYCFTQLGQEMNSAGAGGSIYTNVSKSRFSAIEVDLPPLPEQRAIASILGALDDKIDLNRRMNETLEAMARAIFKSWFVDFDPVRAKAEGKQPFGIDADTAALFPDRLVDSEIGSIPEGWEVVELHALANFQSGKTWAKDDRLEEGGVPVYGANGVVGRARQPLDSKPTIALGKIGSCGALHRIRERAWVTNNAFAVSPTDDQTGEWIWCLLNQLDFSPFIGGSSNPYMPLKSFGHLRFAKPLGGVVRSFEAEVQTSARMRNSLVSESRTLAELRDLLLPKLLSGEIRVKEAEKIVEDAV